MKAWVWIRDAVAYTVWMTLAFTVSLVATAIILRGLSSLGQGPC